MNYISSIDWVGLFIPSMSLLEIVVRSFLVYVLLFIFLHILRKQSGQISVTDILVIAILSESVQGAIAGNSRTISDGIMLAAMIIGWNYLFDYLGFRFEFFGKIIHPAPRHLIKDGKLMMRNLRQEYITKEELNSHIREEGLSDISQVKAAYLEGDGHISIIKKD